MDEVNMEESRKSINTDETLVEVFMTGGPPWGFNISGGSEFGSELFVRKVAEDGIARKVGGLQEGDTLVYINGITCQSRAKAIETVKMGKNELRLKLKRNQSADSAVKAIELKTGPKRSNSFYESVVENMLENVSDDITSTHYSRRRNTLEREMGKVRKKPLGVMKESSSNGDVSEVISEREEGKNLGRFSPPRTDLKTLSPQEERMRFGQAQPSPRSFQRVKIKSVNVTSVMPIKKNDSSEQFKSLAVGSEPRSGIQAASPTGDDALPSVTRNQLISEAPITLQTKSMDEGTPNAQRPWNDRQCQRKASPPPVANKPSKARPESSTESSSPAMTVSKARAMFEDLSKSQENLDTIGTSRNSSTSSPKTEKREMATDKAKQSEDSKNPTAHSLQEPLRPCHAHTKSLPLENTEGPRRDIRRPGSAPHRRSNRQIRPKSAHFASEEESTDSQNLPLGYAAVPSSRLVHGRKSIATTAPSASALYKKESSFRHSSEDLRPSVDTSRWGKKASTLPANQMREAAKRFHKELMKKDPKFRYSLNAAELPARPAHLGSFTGGSSGSSLGSSQDQLNNGELPRRSSGPNVFTRACSTSSLDSSPGHPDSMPSPNDEDNTIMSRLLREQRLSSNGNLKRIEEEARSPRSKTSPREGSLSSSETVEPSEDPSKRTISIQTDFTPTASRKRELFTERRIVTSTMHPFIATIKTQSTIETCIDDVDPALLGSAPLFTENIPKLPADDIEQTSHEKEPSADSNDELIKINENQSKEEETGQFPLPDPDDLPPPPEELLIASPPEKEKPQRVINRKKRDQHSGLGTSRNSSCVSTDSNVSTATMDSGIAVRAYSMSDSSPRNSPTRVTLEFEDDYDNHGVDEGFKGSREELGDADDCPTCGSGPMTPPNELEQNFEEEKDDAGSNSRLDSSDSSQNGTSRLEDLDNKKATLIESMRKKIEELKLQEQEIAEEIKLNEDLGKRVRSLVEKKATQTEFSKYELFIRELNKIVALLLSLTQRLHRYEQMLQDLDMSEEEDKEKRDTLISKIDKLRSQHEEACNLREVNDKRGENVANFLDKYFNEEEFADFQYYVDMKSQLALMQSEIKEKVKLGEERYQALDSTGTF